MTRLLTRLLTRRPLVVALLATAAACALETPTAPPAPAVAEASPTPPPAAGSDLMANADSVVMNVVFSGCFHHSEHRLVLVPDSTGARTRLQTLDANLWRDPRSTFVAPEHLDATQLRGLTTLLDRYRARGDGGGCTSSTTLDVVTFRTGAAPRREHFFDATCGADDVPGVLSLYEVITFKASGR